MHFNENIKRGKLVGQDGLLQLKVFFPKYKRNDDYSVKVLSEAMSFEYIQDLLSKTLELVGKQTAVLTPAPAPLTSGKRKPTKSEARAIVSSRFKKLKY